MRTEENLTLLELLDPGADDDEKWWLSAVCSSTDPEAFFPEKGASNREAIKVCMTCPVRPECLEYAIDFPHRLYGIWGGKPERAVWQMRQERRGRPGPLEPDEHLPESA